MRKKIYRLSEGQFDREKPQVTLSCESIDVTCKEGVSYEGTFTVSCAAEGGTRGLVYSSQPYVLCPVPEFSGNESVIRYKMIHDGFRENDEIKGVFTIIYDGGIKQLPYTIRITAPEITSSAGPIRDMASFCKFAEEHWNEALSLFHTSDFEKMVQRTEYRMLPLYHGYKNALPNSKNLEGFLVAVGAKPRVQYDVSDKELSYFSITENQKESVTISRSGWGYIEIDVKSDSDFITVDTNRITPDFFLGSSMELGFYIHKDRLHEGKNLGAITLNGGGVRRKICITASRNEKDTYVHYEDHANAKRWLDILRLYERYRLKKCTTGEWCAGSAELLDALYASDVSAKYLLMKAHALIVNKQRQDALWIIQDLREDIEDKNGVEWAYLLYLCTLIEPEEEYVKKLTKDIEAIFRDNESLYIFWFLLFLRTDYLTDYARKLSDIENWVKSGYASPLLYIEAYDLYCLDPFLLKGFDDFSMAVLGWVKKHDGLTSAMAIRITHLLEEERSYRKEVYEIAAYTYEKYPEESLLLAIIRYLIMGTQIGEDYLKWYELGVQNELKVTGLFEAYIVSLPHDYVDMLPRSILLYFNYQNTLPAKTKAFIYANVVSHKNEDPDTYGQYIRQIESFALSEMREGHIDDNLAIVYQDLLDHNVIDEDVASAMSRLYFINRVVCVYPNISRILVYEEPLKAPIISKVFDHAAYVPLYTNNYKILLEQSDGTLLNDERGCYAQELIEARVHYNKLKELSSDKLPFFVYDLSTGETGDILDTQEYLNACDFLSSDRYSDSFKQKYYPRFIEAAKEHGRQEDLTPYFLGLSDYHELDTKTSAFILELFIIGEEYDAAEKLLRSYNCNGVSGKLLLKFLNYRLSDENAPVDDLFVSLSALLMKQFLTSEETIRYLNRTYAGPTADMVTLWKFADARQLDTTGLEERILTQILYTETIDDTVDPIFLAYLSHKHNPMIVEAYLSLFAHRYLLEGIRVPDSVFEQIKLLLKRDEKINETCRLGLLAYYSHEGKLNDTDLKLCDEILSDAIRKNIYFAFYRSFDERLLIRYHLYDKLFTEYRGKEGMRLYIRTSIDGMEPQVDEMTEMYDGIYVHQYMVFFGEMLNCEVFEASNPDEILMSGEFSYQDVIEEEEESRYQLLNRMQAGFMYQNEVDLLSAMKRYQGLSVTTDNLFRAI